MMRSLFSGVSGLNNHQTKMDVIGNNISNVNTHGFKKGRVTFKSLLSQQISGAASPNEERGGVNPKQVGLGMQLAAIDTIHTQGALQTTGINTDLALTGAGFFIEKSGDQVFYSRSGAFGLDADGNLVNPSNGFRVQGLPSLDSGNESTDINIPIGKKNPARATTTVRYKSNLNTLTPLIAPNASPQDITNGTWASTIKIKDSLGADLNLRLSFVKNIDVDGNEIPNEWRVTTQVFNPEGVAIEGVQAKVSPDDNSNDFIVQFNNAGAIQSIVDPNNAANVVGEDGQRLNINLQFTVPDSEPLNINLDLGSSGRYDGITQFAANSSAKAYFQDGVSMGYLENFSINSSGIIIGSYSNGFSEELGQIAVAVFSNSGGLEKSGETNFIETVNSGERVFVQAGNQGAGDIQSGVLEMSNVALTNEFSEMIITQRGFQANSRSITTSDTMLEEVLRLKR